MNMGMNNFNGGINGMNANASTINPAMLGASGPGNINPAMVMQHSPNASHAGGMNASMSGISAQFSGLSPQEMQLMQEKAMQRQATTRMNMGNIGGMIGEFHREKSRVSLHCCGNTFHIS